MRVLIVDDEPHVLLWDVLASCGYMVHAVDNGAEALKTIQQWRPDAILLDLIMPVLDGWTFLDAFPNDTECRGVPLAVGLGGDRHWRRHSGSRGPGDYPQTIRCRSPRIDGRRVGATQSPPS